MIYLTQKIRRRAVSTYLAFTCDAFSISLALVPQFAVQYQGDWYFTSGTGNSKGRLVMAEQKPKDEPQKDETDPGWEKFKQALKNIAAVSKEEVDEMRAERERDKKEENHAG